MKKTTQIKLLVLALSITNIFCFGQQNRSAICRLGDITNDSILPYIQSLEVDCSKEVKSYLEKSEQLIAIKQIELKGDASPTEWEQLFGKIKTQSTIKTVVFKENTFSALPYGYEGLFNVENFSFNSNEEIDYATLLDQLAKLPNLKDLRLEVVTIFELPNKLEQLKHIEPLRIINTDESISKNDTTLLSLEKEPVTYDYSVKRETGKMIIVKYIAMAGEIDSDEYKELAKRFTTTNNYIATRMAFVPKYANVDPPIKGIDVERENYLINPKIENILTYQSGTKIRIPANAFIDKNGNPLGSSVKISYREFRDPVDFLVSGIPMKYDTAGEVTNFESAGMFELLASNNNEAVSVAKDKSIDMNFVTTSKDSTYNFYSFNDSSGNWEYLNKPKSVTSSTEIKTKPPTKAFQTFNSIALRTHIYDSTNFASRFEDNMYTYTNLKTTGGKRIKYRYNGKKRSKSTNSLVRINRIRKNKDGDVLFKVNYLQNSHPEMGEFSSLYFVSNENMNVTDFKKQFGKRKYYNDVRITGNGDNIELKLKDNKSIKSLSVSLVTINDKGITKEVKNPNARIRSYNRKLKSRERKFNRTLARGKIGNNMKKVTDRNQLKAYAFNKAKKDMNAEEKEMSYTEWLVYCKQTEENIVADNAVKLQRIGNKRATSTNIIQSFSLRGMGIFNCDQIQRMEEPIEVFAKYKNEDNQKFSPESVYIIDKTGNSVFQYDGTRGYNVNKIAFNKSTKAQNTMLTINKDGSIGLYTSAQFKNGNFKDKTRYDFDVTTLDSKFTTVKDLKMLMGF